MALYYGIYTSELIHVPWLIHENGPRRKVRIDKSENQSETIDQDIVTDQFERLGYTK